MKVDVVVCCDGLDVMDVVVTPSISFPSQYDKGEILKRNAAKVISTRWNEQAKRDRDEATETAEGIYSCMSLTIHTVEM